MIVRLVGYDIFTVKSLEIKDDSCINLGNVQLRPLEVGLAEVEVLADKHNYSLKGGWSIDLPKTSLRLMSKVDTEDERTTVICSTRKLIP